MWGGVVRAEKTTRGGYLRGETVGRGIGEKRMGEGGKYCWERGVGVLNLELVGCWGVIRGEKFKWKGAGKDWRMGGEKGREGKREKKRRGRFFGGVM